MGALNLLGFFSHWKLIALGVIAASILTLAAYARHEHNALQKAKAAEIAATRQAHINQATTTAVDRLARKSILRHQATEKATDAVQALPGANDNLSPDILDAWRRGLRDVAGEPDDTPPPEPPR